MRSTMEWKQNQKNWEFLDCQDSDAMEEKVNFLIKYLSASRKLLIGTLSQENKPVVIERFEFEDRYNTKFLASFGIYRSKGFQWITPAQIHSFRVTC